ncbi:hypothetical protein HK104_003399 [Borealophlyctis nickersoniae]|nr:hypothetical protein HK104_003399 [Borealophlyctis nickersoniae]
MYRVCFNRILSAPAARRLQAARYSTAGYGNSSSSGSVKSEKSSSSRQQPSTSSQHNITHSKGTTTAKPEKNTRLGDAERRDPEKDAKKGDMKQGAAMDPKNAD